MTKARVAETDSGIQGQFNVGIYDQMQRKFRDRGWIQTPELLRRGILHGCALEVGPGPGYLGLEWLSRTDGTTLKGLDISPDMVALAARNAEEYGLSERAEYVPTSGDRFPFDDNSFDAVFTNGSLHEWSSPKAIFNEIWRTLKPGGRVFVSDLRRDMLAPIRWFLWIGTHPREIRPGLTTSINASYTPAELSQLIAGTPLHNCEIVANMIGVGLFAIKQ
jgi:ubiquinone/menaquinone biosynthesis C-methylase UbiE